MDNIAPKLAAFAAWGILKAMSRSRNDTIATIGEIGQWVILGFGVILLILVALDVIN